MNKIRKDCLHYMKGAVVVSIISDILFILLPTISAYLIGNMADAMLSLNIAQIKNYLPSFLLSIVLVIIAAPLFMFYENILLTKKGFSYDSFLMGKMIRKDLRAIEQSDLGAVIERLEEDSAALCWNTVMLLSRPFVIIGYFITLFCLMVSRSDRSVFFILIALIPMIPVIKILIIGKKKAEYRNKGFENDENRRGIEERIVPSANFLSSWKLTSFYAEKLNALFNSYMERTGRGKIKFETQSESLDCVIDIFVPLSVIGLGILLIVKGHLTTGELLAGYLMLSSVIQCHKYTAELFLEFRARNTVLERIALFYGDEEDTSTQSHEGSSSIICKDIAFSYDDVPVFNNISCELKNGAIVCIDGENGSGKSTFVTILSGLYKPNSGVIVDENGVKYSLKDLREAITFADQNSALFSGTIKENLFSNDTERAQKLFKKFGFEKTLDTVIGKEGDGLSPGEKKKLIIIRALLDNGRFLILDEPMNHLDRKGIEALKEELESYKGGKLIISHQDMGLCYDAVIKL